ncbi:hypothetical protein AB0I84_04445 [Streptomyces spectabilis]|uniref:hypothetical protein n=1 Tax=Streptomyces spectabilis TaxID=68270 RepID=UPI00340DBE37
MIRYGFAIKALPKGGKPFGDDEDQDKGQGKDTSTTDGADTGTAPDVIAQDVAPAGDPTDDAADVETGPDDEVVPDSPAEDPSSGAGQAASGEPAEEGPTALEDDTRPWSGDMYDEGDETVPSSAFAAYQGTTGEEAWLDQNPDGTLTGWVRDATGQVWRYTDPDVWAIDVDDAGMIRSHSQATGENGGPESTDHGGQDPLFPPRS